MTIVIVHWNQPQRCSLTLDALAAQSLGARALVIDNASHPTAVESLRDVVAAAPLPCHLIERDSNTGFGPAANVGLRIWLADCSDEWVGVAPHDALLDPTTLERLVAAAEHEHHVGLACADVGDGETPVVDPYFGGMTRPGQVAEGWERADYPHGTFMLARRGCLQQVGLFDERYFAYCEEADLGLRARAAGWQIGLERGARVHNPTMRSGSPVTDYLMNRNTLLLVREHSGLYHASIRLLIAAIQLVRGVLQPSSRPWLFSPVGRLAGIADYLRGRFGPPPEWLLAEADGPVD